MQIQVQRGVSGIGLDGLIQGFLAVPGDLILRRSPTLLGSLSGGKNLGLVAGGRSPGLEVFFKKSNELFEDRPNLRLQADALHVRYPRHLLQFPGDLPGFLDLAGLVGRHTEIPPGFGQSAPVPMEPESGDFKPLSRSRKISGGESLFSVGISLEVEGIDLGG